MTSSTNHEVATKFWKKTGGGNDANINSPTPGTPSAKRLGQQEGEGRRLNQENIQVVDLTEFHWNSLQKGVIYQACGTKLLLPHYKMKR